MAIKDEREISQEYRIRNYPVKSDLVEISQDNVARAEAIISVDSNYNKSIDKDGRPIYASYKSRERKGQVYLKYGGSTAFWMTKLKEALENKLQENLENIIYGAVSAVDRENTTHLTADKNNSLYAGTGAGRREITKRILNISHELMALLKDRKKGFELIKRLSERTADGKGRENYSFATKFCHYACYYFFEGEDAQDNYSIYDEVMGNALVLYAKEYLKKEIKKEDFQNYQLYSNIIDEIREAAAKISKPRVSRNGFDHLLWYFHKGHLQILKSQTGNSSFLQIQPDGQIIGFGHPYYCRACGTFSAADNCLVCGRVCTRVLY